MIGQSENQKSPQSNVKKMKSELAINVSKNLNANVTLVTNVSLVVTNSSQETVTENAFVTAKVSLRFRSKVDSPRGGGHETGRSLHTIILDRPVWRDRPLSSL